MTSDNYAREMHRSFRVLAQFNGIYMLRNVSREEAITAWRFLGHPLRDYLIACAAMGKMLPGSLKEKVESTVWLKQILEAAETDHQPFVDAVTLRGGVELQLTTKAIEVLAERAAAKKPVKSPSDPNAVERRVHVREKAGDKRLIFLRAIEKDRAGPVTLIDYGGRQLARFTIDASGFDTFDDWYMPGGGAGVPRKVPDDDNGQGSPTSDLKPPRGFKGPAGGR